MATRSLRSRSALQSDRGSTPTWIEPMLAKLHTAPLTAGNWLLERKFDGYRALCFRTPKQVRLLSRNGNILNAKFPEVVAALEKQPCTDFVADGEIIAEARTGSSFARLQQRLKPLSLKEAADTGIPVSYWLFDILFAQGIDLRHLPLEERKQFLGDAVKFGHELRYTKHSRGDPQTQLQAACKRGWEGLIAKQARSPYTSGRSGLWLKLKCSKGQEFVVGGYTDPKGGRVGFGSLLLGYYQKGRLIYAGRVGTGFDHKFLREFHAKLRSLERPQSPFEPHVAIPRTAVNWVQPKWVAQIDFTEWTTDGQLRHPRFQGLRPDKAAAQVVRES